MALGYKRCAAEWQVLCCVLFLSVIPVVIGEMSYSIVEEMKRGSVVGSLANDLGLDVKKLAARRARIDFQGRRRYCDINLDTGDFIVQERIDREELCGTTSSCVLHFEFVLENPLELHNVALNIEDINDNPPSFPKDVIKLEISESAVTGARFPLDRAHDPDIGINSVQDYMLASNEHFVLHVYTSSERGKYGEIVLEHDLDREMQQQHSLLLTAIDGGAQQKSGTVLIDIIVLDANDNVPLFSETLYKVNLTENSPLDTLVVTVSAIDKDEGANGEVTFEFSHISEKARPLFSIDPRTGNIKVVGKIDFEEATYHEIEVQAKDGAGLAGHCKVFVEITDINDNAPVITVKSLFNPIPENSPPGTEVAIINVQDQDSGENSKVVCFILVNVPFKLRSSVRNYYSLETKTVLDREEVSEFNITITATDKGFPPLSSSTTILFTISDINDNSPIFNQSSYSAYVVENNKPGLSICSVQARDPDWKQNGTVSYSLLPSDVHGMPLSSCISINPDSGVIHAVRTFDYEQFRHFQFYVLAKDKGSPPLSSNVTVNIFITDQNDNFPQILYPGQSESSFMTEVMPKSVHKGNLVSKVVAVDADSGQNAWLSYQMLKTTDLGLFTIGLHSGEIRTLRDISEVDAIQQRLIILVKDNGKPSYSATCTVNLLVSDNVSEDVSKFKDLSKQTGTTTNLTGYLVISLAVVSFLFLVFIIIILAARFCQERKNRLLFDGPNATPRSYFPPNYAEVESSGTLRQSYNYDVCLTAGSSTSDFKFVRPYCEQTLPLDHNAKILTNFSDENTDKGTEVACQQKPANTEWRFSQGQRPGPSGSQRPEEAGPWPNPPTEAEQLQALMAAANEVSAATATLDAGTMGLSTRYSPQFTLQHVPDYRQNVYIPGSTSTLTGTNSQPEGKNPQPSSGNKKKSGKKEKK
ncbi:protocadherin gamma-A11-like isoform X13 [Polyodon spathula]|uniref:protocadherin gamma-A11-like isoform X13 n=1 Tax=Polyodon spathula TaxID=7913 RepID=UPI001B7EEB25|nr:protocadherin gamma-A11-like isoform X13 [Polyodon spathula]